MPHTHVNSATGIMGVTGSGKSALAATLAKYLWKHHKRILRYYNSDGGGFPAPVQEVQALGILEVFRMRTRDPGDLGLSFETAYRACQGWWPRIINPATGEVPPGVEMIPPIRTQFQMSCPTGHLVKTVPAESLLTPAPCPTCKVMVTKQNMQVRKVQAASPGFERVGGVFFDGLSSMLAWELMELGHRAGRMELKGEEAAIGGKVTSGDLKFGGVTRSHVGFAQTRGEELVHLTLGIPNLVVPPIFTMLTHEDVDDRSLSITGPKIAGRAKTDEAPQWFGNMLETAKVPALDGSNAEQRILYLAEFTDPTGRRHLCKSRAAPGTMPAYLADPPGGDTDPTKAFTQVNLGVFFEMLDAALTKGIAQALTEFPDTPGMPEGLVEIGGVGIIPAASEPAPTLQAGPQTLSAPAAPAVASTPGAAAPVAPAAPTPPTPPKGRKRATPAAPPAAVPAIPASPSPTPAPAGVAPSPPTGETAAPPAAPGPAAAQASPPTPAVPAGNAPPAGAVPAVPSGGGPVHTPAATPSVSRVAAPPGVRPRPTSITGPGTPAVPRPPAAAPRPPVTAAGPTKPQ